MKKSPEPAKNRFPRTLGRGYVDKANEIVLAYGKGRKRREWTRVEMASQLRCVDYIAARDYVTPVLEEFGVDSAAMIYGMDSSRFFMHPVPGTGVRGVRIRRLRHASMNVLMALIKHELRRNPEHWLAGMSNDLKTLATLVRRQEQVVAKKRRDRKKR